MLGNGMLQNEHQAPFSCISILKQRQPDKHLTGKLHVEGELAKARNVQSLALLAAQTSETPIECLSDGHA